MIEKKKSSNFFGFFCFESSACPNGQEEELTAAFMLYEKDADTLDLYTCTQVYKQQYRCVDVRVDSYLPDVAFYLSRDVGGVFVY